MLITEEVLKELDDATTWLSTTQIADKLGKSRSSVGRILRRLWAKKMIEKTKIPQDECGNVQWASIKRIAAHLKDSPGIGLPDTSPTFRKRKLKPNVRLLLIQQSAKQHAANSNQGGHVMQIDHGVEQIVEEWVAAGKKFSAHEVTKELRNRVNAGTIQIDQGQSGTVFVAGNAVSAIEHTVVNLAVRLLMTSGKFPTYGRQYTGIYFEYLPSNQITPQTPDADPDPSDPTGTPPTDDGSSYDGTPSL